MDGLRRVSADLRGAVAGAQHVPAARALGAREQLHDQLVWQIRHARDPRARRRSGLGLHRHAQPGAGVVLRAGRLLDGHVPAADDRQAGPVQERPARLHGLPRLQGAALALGAVSQLLVRARHGGGRARPAGAGLRLLRIPLPVEGRLFLHPHAGAHLRRGADVFPQRFRLRRQQRFHRLQVRPRPRHQRSLDASPALRRLDSAARRGVPALPLAHLHQGRPDHAGDPRRRKPRALLGLQHRPL
ncbi:MAG: hypothetical protein BWX86_02651 [Verrucomicrobia bacterium ADurb.Bin122]|nr:MAG: hypothetical protein BWX86_02651 [Verrucomicrobia bacterium ADurb.Bin122]